MVYCNRSFDVIPIFAANVCDARRVFQNIRGPDQKDPFAYSGAVSNASAPSNPLIAVPNALEHFGDDAAAMAHQSNLELLRAAGAKIVEIDFTPFAEAGELVFGSAIVAERLIDYGDFIQENQHAVVAPVAQAINAGRSYDARSAFEALHRIAEIKVEIRSQLAGFDAFLTPTVPRLYTIDAMRADPMAKNTIMGTYTYFANPLGLSAIAVPGITREDELPSSVCFVGLSGEDFKLCNMAEEFEQVVREFLHLSDGES